MSLISPDLVLLDLDGTLVDSIPDLSRCLNMTLRDLQQPERKLEDVRNWVGNGVETLIHRALINDIEGQADPELVQQALPIFMRYYHAEPCELTECYPGVREGLTTLKADGKTLGIVTNKNEEFVPPILEKLGILDHMDIIIGGNTLEKRKPDPLPLLHAASMFKQAPEQSVMVGDSISDVNAARAAGFQIVCVSYGYNHGQDIYDTKPDAVIDSLEQLPVLFQ